LCPGWALNWEQRDLRQSPGRAAASSSPAL